mgnify:CR=1 FL=1
MLAGAAIALATAPVSGRVGQGRDQLSTYVAARAADAEGDPATAAQMFATLVRDMPNDTLLRRRAIANAIEAGDMGLALQLAKVVPIEQTALDLRLLLVADQLRQGQEARAIELLGTRGGIIDSSFLSPFVEAWARAGKRDSNAADSLNQVPDSSALAQLRDEHRALILLKLKRPAEAAPLAEIALGKAGGRGKECGAGEQRMTKIVSMLVTINAHLSVLSTQPDRF